MYIHIAIYMEATHIHARKGIIVLCESLCEAANLLSLQTLEMLIILSRDKLTKTTHQKKKKEDHTQ